MFVMYIIINVIIILKVDHYCKIYILTEHCLVYSIIIDFLFIFFLYENFYHNYI